MKTTKAQAQAQSFARKTQTMSRHDALMAQHARHRQAIARIDDLRATRGIGPKIIRSEV